jgi:hypothetical protein
MPLLIATIWLIIADIDDEKFPQHLLHSIKEEFKGSIADVITNKKYEAVLKILTKKLENCNELRIIEAKDALKMHLFKEPELQNCFNDRSNQTKLDLNNEDNLKIVVKKLNLLYEKMLRFKHFDERIFFTEKHDSDFSPIKITPFKRQKSLNFEIKKPAAFKRLDYNSGSVSSRSQSTTTTPINNYNFSALSNSNSNLRFINNLNNKIECATPTSRVFMMDNWVSDYIRDFTFEKLHKFNVNIVVIF